MDEKVMKNRKRMFQGDYVDSKRILYTSSEFAKGNLLYLQEVGYLTSLKPHISSRQHMNSYLFFIVMSGRGKVTYGEREYNMVPGDCAFLDCHQPYAHDSSDDLWSLKWVHFYGNNMGGIYEKYKQRGGKPCFSVENFKSYAKMIEEIYNVADSSLYIRDMKINEKLASLLCLLMESGWNPEYQLNTPTTAKKQVLPIKEYLDGNYMHHITLDNLATNFFINKFYMSRLFKEQFGISINQYLQHTRITNAKKLLRFTDQTIENIGRQCGMEDSNYFTRTFKKIEGVTPSAFRKMWSMGEG